MLSAEYVKGMVKVMLNSCEEFASSQEIHSFLY